MPVFGVRVSVTLYFMCAHIILNRFSSVWVSEWPLIFERASQSIPFVF